MTAVDGGSSRVRFVLCVNIGMGYAPRTKGEGAHVARTENLNLGMNEKYVYTE